MNRGAAGDQVGVGFVSSVVVYVWSCLNGAIPPVAHAVKFCFLAWFMGKGATDFELTEGGGFYIFVCSCQKSCPMSLVCSVYSSKSC